MENQWLGLRTSPANGHRTQDRIASPSEEKGRHSNGLDDVTGIRPPYQSAKLRFRNRTTLPYGEGPFITSSTHIAPARLSGSRPNLRRRLYRIGESTKD